MEEYERSLRRQEAERDPQGWNCCIGNKEGYILWKERRGRLAMEGAREVEQEE
jgi:hypothetical protein